MTRVDFYILDSDSEQQRDLYACRLIEKAWRLGHRVHVLAPSMENSRALDDLLWSFRPDAFIPHAVLPAGKSTPVHIGHDCAAAIHHGLLINLQPTLPEHFGRFERLAEIVTQAPDALAGSREKFRFYRDRGYDINHHRISLDARS